MSWECSGQGSGEKERDFQVPMSGTCQVHARLFSPNIHDLSQQKPHFTFPDNGSHIYEPRS